MTGTRNYVERYILEIIQGIGMYLHQLTGNFKIKHPLRFSEESLLGRDAP